MDDTKDARLAQLKKLMGLDATGDLAADKMVSDAPIYKALGLMQLTPEQEAQAAAPEVQKALMDQQNYMGAASAAGSIGKAGKAVAEGLTGAEAYIAKIANRPKVEGGAAQRLGIKDMEGNFRKTADQLTGEINQNIQGFGTNPEDMAVKLQMLKKLTNKKY